MLEANFGPKVCAISEGYLISCAIEFDSLRVSEIWITVGQKQRPHTVKGAKFRAIYLEDLPLLLLPPFSM